VDNSAIT